MEKNLDYGYYYNKEIPEGNFSTFISKNDSSIFSAFYEESPYLTKKELRILEEKSIQRKNVKSDINYLNEKEKHIKYTISKYVDISEKVKNIFQENIFLKGFVNLNWKEHFELKIEKNEEYNDEYKKELMTILYKEYEDFKPLLYKYNRALRMVKSLDNEC